MIPRMAKTSIDELRTAAKRAPDETVEAIFRVGRAICERLDEIIDTTSGADVSGDVHSIKTLVEELAGQGGSGF